MCVGLPLHSRHCAGMRFRCPLYLAGWGLQASKILLGFSVDSVGDCDIPTC